MTDDTKDSKPKKPAAARPERSGSARKPSGERAERKPAAKAPEVVKKPSRAIHKPGEEPKKHAPAEMKSAAPAAKSPMAVALGEKVKQVQNVVDHTVSQVDKQGRAYATGKRKNAIARVWLQSGKGQIVINGRALAVYFARPTQQMLIEQPFKVINRAGQYDVMATVVGGGLSGQAGAVRHGVSRALTYYDPELRQVLKRAGLLTRDSRVVERKKYGKHKARRSTQWVKR